MSTENAEPRARVDAIVSQSVGQPGEQSVDVLTCDLSDDSPVWAHLERMRDEHNTFTKRTCAQIVGFPEATVNRLLAPEVSRELIREILLRYRRECQAEKEGNDM